MSFYTCQIWTELKEVPSQIRVVIKSQEFKYDRLESEVYKESVL